MHVGGVFQLRQKLFEIDQSGYCRDTYFSINTFTNPVLKSLNDIWIYQLS